EYHIWKRVSKKKVLLRGVFINRDTNGEGVLKVGTTLIRVSTVMGILYFDIPYQELRIGEIGYVIGEKWHGKGYGTEAVKKMISEYLSKDRLYLIEAKCNIDNKPSLNLLEKVGFIKDGVLRKRRIDKNTGEYRDLVVYSITTNDK
ncbi:GNAT family N-acetyltransferase, partial [Agathobacter sp.]|uniref:GNAT family N-acetyltransferase n=1 Tax=Agathobacter sp. TaxID=2021311 RepID=UPI003AB40AFE